MAEFERVEEEDDLSRQINVKYVVQDLIEPNTLIIKFHLVKRELSVLGYASFTEFISYVIDAFILDFDGIKVSPENSHSQRNKLKYVFNYKSKKSFEALVERLENAEGLDIDRIKKHGRLA